jgi:flagellin-like protein
MAVTGRILEPWRRYASTERSVTPVIGVVLMLGITVSLIVVVAPMILTESTSVNDGPPPVELTFVYEEGVETTQSDTFGTTGGSGDGLLTIRVTNGGGVDAGQIEITSNVSGGNLVDDTASSEFDTGETIRSGDTMTVWTERGDTIEVIWTSEDGEKSAILDDITIRPTRGNLPPGAPSPDYDCEFIEDQTPGDVEIDGVVVECDLDQFSVDDVDIENDGAVIGEVEADGDINIDGATYGGDVVSGADGSDGDIDIAGNSTVNGDLEAGGSGDLDLDEESTIDGDVTAAGQVDLDADSEVTGAIDAETGDVTITGGSEVGEGITATAKVDIDAGSSVGGDVTTDGDVDLTGGSIIDGSIEANGGSTVTVTDSTVRGDVTSAVDVDVDGATITGSVSGDGNVDVVASTIGSVSGDGDVDVADSTIENHVTVGGSFSCTSSTINGESCSDYQTPDYEVTIESTNSPVEEGNTLEVTATIENTGIDQGDQTVTLELDGNQKDSKSLQISGGSQTTETFQWSTSSGDSDDYTATVTSDNDTDARMVSVATSVPTQFDSLEATLVDVKEDNNQDNELREVDFSYTLDQTDKVTFEVEKGGSVVDSTVELNTDSGTVTLLEQNSEKEDLAVWLRADIDGGECYEIRVPDGETQGTTYDILSEGTEC